MSSATDSLLPDTLAAWQQTSRGQFSILMHAARVKAYWATAPLHSTFLEHLPSGMLFRVGFRHSYRLLLRLLGGTAAVLAAFIAVIFRDVASCVLAYWLPLSFGAKALFTHYLWLQGRGHLQHVQETPTQNTYKVHMRQSLRD